MSKIFDHKQYYFENLIHMAFLGTRSSDGKFTVDQINRALWTHLGGKNKVNEPSQNSFLSGNSLEQFIELILADQLVIKEYLSFMRIIVENQQLYHGERKGKYFTLIKPGLNDTDSSYAIKSIAPGGLPTLLKSPTEGRKTIFIDLYTVPQIFNGEIVGIQGLAPIVNERREYYVRSTRHAELNIFHSLRVDLKNRAPSLLKNILDYEELSEQGRIVVLKAKDYIESVIDQTSSSLEIYSKYAYSEGDFSESCDISDLVLRLQNVTQKNKVLNLSINYSVDKEIINCRTTLLPGPFEKFIYDLLRNAEKEYDRLDTNLVERQVEISLKKASIFQDHSLGIEVLSSGTCISDEVILSEAGVRPINSTTSSGLGLYFFNTLLELTGALFPRLPNQPQRHFVLENTSTGVKVSFYYPLNLPAHA